MTFHPTANTLLFSSFYSDSQLNHAISKFECTAVGAFRLLITVLYNLQAGRKSRVE